jgi:hypothetical protein
MFLVWEGLLNNHLRIKQRVGSGGDSYHFPILLKLDVGSENASSPFKFNAQWLEDEGFIKFVGDELVPFERDNKELIAIQFVSNLKKVTEATGKWVYDKRYRGEKELLQI